MESVAAPHGAWWPLGVIEVIFDPRWLSQGPLSLVLSWQGLAAGAVVLASLLVAAVAVVRYRPARRGDVPSDAPALRLDDLLFIAVAVVPGAVIGGRIVHGLDHLDTYAPNLVALLDPARGSLSLLGAVVGGTLSAAYIARILSGSRPDWRRWLEVAAPLVLFLIVGAKFSQFLGGGGQGSPWSGEQAVAFLGPGPWQSLAPAMPSVPAQLLEGAWAAVGVVVLAVRRSAPALRHRLPLGARLVAGRPHRHRLHLARRRRRRATQRRAGAGHRRPRRRGGAARRRAPPRGPRR